MDIFKAIKTGNKASVIEYLSSHGDINARDFYSMTPLIAAADEGRADIVKLLIESNADPDAQDKIGQTALHLAAARNYTEIVKLLIKAKAGLNIRAINGLTAYQFAAENGRQEAAMLIKNTPPKAYGSAYDSSCQPY